MRLRRVLAGLSCVGAGTGAGSVLYFSPSAEELAARRRKLLGLHGALGDDSDADSLHDGGAGQHGGAPQLVMMQVAQGFFPGVQGLVRAELCSAPPPFGDPADPGPFPQMKRWLAA